MDILRISNAQRKFLQGLKLKKNRLKYGQFIAEGSKVVGEILNGKCIDIKELYCLPSWIEEQSATDKTLLYPCYRFTKKDLERVSGLKSPDGVLALCRIPESKVVADASRILFLDGINNPGNLGTLLRTADWYGVDQVVLTEGSVDPFNAKVVQAAMGSLGRIPMCTMNLEMAHRTWSHLPVYHSLLSGSAVESLDVDPTKWILAIGSESHGLSQQSLAVQGQHITITKKTPSPIDSLNAAVATGILLSKFS